MTILYSGVPGTTRVPVIQVPGSHCLICASQRCARCPCFSCLQSWPITYLVAYLAPLARLPRCGACHIRRAPRSTPWNAISPNSCQLSKDSRVDCLLKLMCPVLQACWSTASTALVPQRPLKLHRHRLHWRLGRCLLLHLTRATTMSSQLPCVTRQFSCRIVGGSPREVCAGGWARDSSLPRSRRQWRRR